MSSEYGFIFRKAKLGKKLQVGTQLQDELQLPTLVALHVTSSKLISNGVYPTPLYMTSS